MRYVYECRTCDKEFEVGMTLREHDRKKPRCPYCRRVLHQLLTVLRFRIN